MGPARPKTMAPAINRTKKRKIAARTALSLPFPRTPTAMGTGMDPNIISPPTQRLVL
jgi:hypothetical protein